MSATVVDVLPAAGSGSMTCCSGAPVGMAINGIGPVGSGATGGSSGILRSFVWEADMTALRSMPGTLSHIASRRTARRQPPRRTWACTLRRVRGRLTSLSDVDDRVG